MADLSPRALLQLNLSAHWLRLRNDLFERLLKGFAGWTFRVDKSDAIGEQNWQFIRLIQFLQHQINLWLDEVAVQQQQFNHFSHNYHRAEKYEEQLEHLIAIAEALDYSKSALSKIRRKKALWLDESAIYDRHVQIVGGKEQDIASSLDRLAQIVPHLLQQANGAFIEQIWSVLSLHKTLLRPLEYHGNAHIRTQAFHCLSKALQALPEHIDHQIPANIVQYIYRNCLDDKVDIWLRSEAITLVAHLDPEQLTDIVDKIFVTLPTADMYLRARVVKLICQQPLGDVTQMLFKLQQDPSDYVRQTLAKYSQHITANLRWKVLQQLLDHEQCAQVRAQAYLTLAECLKTSANDVSIIQKMQLSILEREQDHFALRTFFHTLPISVLTLDWTTPANQSYITGLTQQLTNVHQNNQNIGVRRWASQTREHLWAVTRQDILSLGIQEQLIHLPLHQAMKFNVPRGTSKEDLHRYLARLGGQRFGFDIEDKGSKIKVRAGFRFGFRFWRFLHEFRTPATDKRQDHNHLKGRLYFGLSQTSSQRMAEMSVTKVPGEPLFVSDEQGWRDYLPLLDQVISSLDQGWPTQAVKIYSTEGITELMPPSNIVRRLYARVAIQWQFQQLAQLRNWQEKDRRPASTYLQKLVKLGFTISIRGYIDEGADKPGQTHGVDPKVQRFFPVIRVPFVLPPMADMQNYFYSVYQNTIVQLMAFTSVVTLSYLGFHAAKLLQMRRSRSNIPLVIGGWGTRGKSGTERLKAALFNGMGLSVVSKTTGCEAMFLYGPANRPTKEMFLFRPYDKATIWEQVFLTNLSSRLGADVFLWECMGLTPRYIDIIQNQWMRDDISTITNCYPDHEELQGPAGIEIPIVMQRFVPKQGVMITTEESMLPLLEDEARAKNTQIYKVTWLEAGLLTDDVLGRFPYEEHPNNIALVAEMASSLGIEQDFALKEMADNVMADLGVLKIYPLVHVQQRRIEFINGMSANERLGAMSNWQRTGLAAQTLIKEPGVWKGIVINNRVDRIARSKVFASMLVNDSQGDCYFFIGNNLGGLQNYIAEAWQIYQQDLQLIPEDKNVHTALERLEAQVQKFRIPTNEVQVLQRLQAAVDGLNCKVKPSLPQGVTAEFVSTWHLDPADEGLTRSECTAIELLFNRDAERYLQYQNFKAQLSENLSSEVGDNIVDWLFECFKSQWVVIEDYYSTGNQTINTIVQQTPPGLLSRVIGMQNIKGTGLDFIYRWQAWNTIYNYCEILSESREDALLEDTAKDMTTWEEFGLLDQQKVRQTLERVKQRPETQKELLQAQFRLIEQRLDKQLNIIEQTLQGSPSKSKIIVKVIDSLEAFLDSGDAIKRRKNADKIYQALMDHLISYDKASVELAKITKAQKGGWLTERLARVYR